MEIIKYPTIFLRELTGQGITLEYIQMQQLQAFQLFTTILFMTLEKQIQVLVELDYITL